MPTLPVSWRRTRNCCPCNKPSVTSTRKRCVSVSENRTNGCQHSSQFQVMMINKRMVNTRLDCQSKLKENNKLMDIKAARIKVLNKFYYILCSVHLNLVNATRKPLMWQTITNYFSHAVKIQQQLPIIYQYVHYKGLLYDTKFQREKLWRIWQITRDLPKFSCPKISPLKTTKVAMRHSMNTITYQHHGLA